MAKMPEVYTLMGTGRDYGCVGPGTEMLNVKRQERLLSPLSTQPCRSLVVVMALVYWRQCCDGHVELYPQQMSMRTDS